MADEIEVHDEWFDQRGICHVHIVPARGVVIDVSASHRTARNLSQQIAALLRFQSAMTPEMWEAVSDAIDDRREWLRSSRDPDLRSNLRRAEAALDTLRQDLGRQG